MKRLALVALASISLASFTTASSGFETVLVGEIEADRIMIAPPRSDLERTIRNDLQTALDTATGERASADARQLYYFYGSRHFEPLWLDQTDSGYVFSDAAETVLALFENAHLQGLDPDDYLVEGLDVASVGNDADGLAALEAQFSAAILRYATDAHAGRLDPRSVSDTIDVASKTVDEAELFDRLAESSDPAAVLMDYHPKHREFVALRDLLAQHYSGEVESRTPIPEGGLIRPGGSDVRIIMVRERLGTVLMPDADAMMYDTALQAAVEAFQAQMGLNPDGVVGPATFAAINGMGGASRADIIANMERWRWMPEDLGDFNVFVNIPEYSVEVVKRDQVVWESRTVVGTTQRKTPVFSDNIRHVVTNPYWNVPPTILSQDVMPRVAANPSYLASQNMELFFNGAQVDPWMVDWSLANPNAFTVRQRPGASNALGQVKFLFPNTHDVYLHDTNSPGLFSRSMRALSSGCVRVQDPFGFAEALLEFEPTLTVASLENTLGGTERWFNMNETVPVHLAYFTLRIDDEGSVRSYGDVYGHNDQVIEMLGL